MSDQFNTPDVKLAKRVKIATRENNRLELLGMAKEACRNAGGAASISERYAFVDTKRFEVKERRGYLSEQK